MEFKKIAPCWSCGSEEECYEDCECAKCQDPEGYEIWKYENPEQYEKWINKQERKYYEENY